MHDLFRWLSDHAAVGIAGAALIVAILSARAARTSAANSYRTAGAAETSAANSTRSASASEASAQIASESRHAARTPRLTIETDGEIQSGGITLRVWADRDLDELEIHARRPWNLFRPGLMQPDHLVPHIASPFDPRPDGAIAMLGVDAGVEYDFTGRPADPAAVLADRGRARVLCVCTVGSEMWRVALDTGEVALNRER